MSDVPLGTVAGVVAGTRIVCGVVGGAVSGTTCCGNVGGGAVCGGFVRGEMRGVVTGGVVTGVVAGVVTGGAVVVGAATVVVCLRGMLAATFGGWVVVDGSSDGVTAVVRGTRDDVTAPTASYDAPTAIRQNTNTKTRLITP